MAPRQKQQLDVDIVVIGAGLSGLMYGIVACQKGYRVAVVEKHFKPGGYATNFARERQSYVFDCSLHKITGLGPQGNLRDALMRAKLWDKLEFHFYDRLSCIVIGERRYEIPADPAELQRRLQAWFPASRAGLDRFFEDVATHGRQNYMFARMALGEYTLDRNLLERSRELSRIRAKQYFTDLFADADLVLIFSTLAINLGVVAEDADALYYLHFAYTFLTQQAAYVMGSSQSLSDALAAEVCRLGGSVHLKERVEAVNVVDGAIASVESRTCLFNTSRVVATCCPNVLHSALRPADALGDAFRAKLAGLELGYGAFSVYLALDVPPEQLGFEQSEYLISDTDVRDLAPEERQSDERYLRLPLGITNYHKLDPSLGPIVVMTVLEHAGRWFELEKAEYKAEKARVMQLLLARALRVFPQLAGHILVQEASTPRTNQRYTSSPGGSAFGYKAVPARNVRFLQRPSVRGLSFCGTWVSGAGYEPAMCLGFTQATLLPDAALATG
ncbi:MAG: NAD(P)/FAD-dependent oxidoreductase [Deltaproteobacteria bacterium]